MALVKGTNCGFVSVAPSADPAATGGVIDSYVIGFKATSPAGNNNVTELGWYQSLTNNDAADYYCGIYSHDAGNNRPNALIATQSSGQSSTANTAGWNKYTGLSISLTASTTYWIAAGVKNVTNQNQVDYAADAGEKYDWKTTATGVLPSPWGASTGTFGRLIAIFAKYAAAGGEEHTKNLSDMINMTDARIASFGLNKADSMSLSDSISRGFGLNKADSITLSDGITKAFGLNKGDTVNLSDSISSKTFGLNKGDTINLSDNISSKAFGLNKADNISLSDSISKSFSFSKADTINMTDEISTLLTLLKNLSDTINMSDAISSKTFGLNKTDIVSLSDSVAKEFGLNKADTINMTDEAIKAAGLLLSDNITLSDSLDSAVLGVLAALYNFLAKNRTFNFNAKARTFNFNAKARTFNFNAKARP